MWYPERGIFCAMFTGIINNLGKLEDKKNTRFTFSAPTHFCNRIKNGTSIAINGACLTVVDKPTKKSFSVEIMPETLNITMLGYVKNNSLVNLELPLTTRDFLSGHLVQGHVDGVGKLKKLSKKGDSFLLKFSIPETYSKFIVAKGSITVNGVSLTVISTKDATFTVGIIPHTWKHTIFHTLKNGNLVNIEVDILAKYVFNLMKKEKRAI